jgi:RNA polymerase sigma-70 factor (ECF subfamily)
MIDPLHFSELFAAHAARLVLYARQWLDRAAAEDAVQEAYVRLLQQRRLPENPRAWLYCAVRNEATTLFRSSQRRQRREERSAGAEVWFEASEHVWLDGQTAQSAMENLPPEQREILVLRIWGQMKLSEIANVTGLSTSTIFDQYRAGLVALRKAMGVTCQNSNQ